MRERAQLAMLELCGEVGYQRVSLEQLLDRSGLSAEVFHREFADLEDCFTAAYVAEVDALSQAMLAAARAAGEWRAGVRGALTTVLRFADDWPTVAKALIGEVHFVGGEALEKREEVLQQLAVALDAGCARSPDSLAAVPTAPNFIVGAVEGVMAMRLAREEDEPMLAVLPELMHLVVASFLGQEAAEGEGGHR